MKKKQIMMIIIVLILCLCSCDDREKNAPTPTMESTTKEITGSATMGTEQVEAEKRNTVEEKNLQKNGIVEFVDIVKPTSDPSSSNMEEKDAEIGIPEENSSTIPSVEKVPPEPDESKMLPCTPDSFEDSYDGSGTILPDDEL